MSTQQRTIAVFGMGNVGRAVHEALRGGYPDVIGYDLLPPWSGNADAALSASVWFVCVPTPAGADMHLHLEFVLGVAELAAQQTHAPLLIVKSTLPIGGMKVLERTYSRVVYMPEFLVERRPDASKPDRIVIGARSEELIDEIMDIVLRVPGWGKAPIFVVTPEEAEVVKLGSNSFLAVKVALANDLAELCQRKGIRYDKVREAVSADPRIGLSHMVVPGPDKRLGFGGACFPKDLDELAANMPRASAFVAAARQNRQRRPECYAVALLRPRQAVQLVGQAEATQSA